MPEVRLPTGERLLADDETGTAPHTPGALVQRVADADVAAALAELVAIYGAPAAGDGATEATLAAVRATLEAGVPALEAGRQPVSAKWAPDDVLAPQPLNALNAAAGGAVTRIGTVSVEFIAAMAGTVTFEVSLDGGVVYRNLILARADTTNTSAATLTNPTGGQLWQGALPAGATHFRARVSTYTSGNGSARVAYSAVPYQPAPVVSGTVVLSNTSVAPNSDGSSTLSVYGPAAALFNGTNYDRQRGVQATTLLASAARTGAPAATDQTNWNGRNLIVLLNVTAAGAAGGLTVRVEGKDPVSGAYYVIAQDPAPVTATGLNVFEIGGDVDNAGAGPRLSVRRPLPRTFRVSVQHADATSYTYSLGIVQTV